MSVPKIATVVNPWLDHVNLIYCAVLYSTVIYSMVDAVVQYSLQNLRTRRERARTDRTSVRKIANTF